MFYLGYFIKPEDYRTSELTSWLPSDSFRSTHLDRTSSLRFMCAQGAIVGLMTRAWALGGHESTADSLTGRKGTVVARSKRFVLHPQSDHTLTPRTPEDVKRIQKVLKGSEVVEIMLWGLMRY